MDIIMFERMKFTEKINNQVVNNEQIIKNIISVEEQKEIDKKLKELNSRKDNVSDEK